MDRKKKNKKLFYIFLATSLIAVCIFVFILIFPKKNKKQEIKQEANNKIDCVTSAEERTVRGASLKGIIEPEQKVTAYFGYYDCHEPKREDLVLIRYAGDSNPIIKIIKGVTGDSFALKEATGGWNILINNEVLKNAQGKEYLIDQRGYRMLSLYARDYNNKIPERAFLVLGNLIGGSTDSTAFGLIDKGDIIAKAELK